MNHEPNTYGDSVASVYDEIPAIGDPGGGEQCVRFLSSLVAPGPVLELGIGTGRIALPMAKEGYTVTGIDISSAIVDVLRAKPGGAEITVLLSDLRTFTVDDRFPLAYVVFDSVALLTTQDDQVSCFQRTADALEPGGLFVVHAYTPLTADHADPVKTLSVEGNRVVLQVSRHDPAQQRLHSKLLVFEDGNKVAIYPLPLRYIWPSEMDLMARIAGLELRERWGGWSREPYTAENKEYVCVYAKPGGEDQK